jgi:hypothetical protein
MSLFYVIVIRFSPEFHRCELLCRLPRKKRERQRQQGHLTGFFFSVWALGQILKILGENCGKLGGSKGGTGFLAKFSKIIQSPAL